MIKHFLISKSYAIFVCYSLGNKDDIGKFFNLKGFDFNTFEFNENLIKEKDFTVESLIRESNKYNFRRNLKNQFNDSNALAKRFAFLEERILNQAKENHELELNHQRLLEEKRNYLIEMEDKKEKIERELQKLLYDEANNTYEINYLTNKINKTNVLKLNNSNEELDFLNELTFLATKIVDGQYRKEYDHPISPKAIDKNNFNHKHVHDIFKKFELKALTLISSLTVYQKTKPVIFEEKLNKRKDHNKRVNFEEGILMNKKSKKLIF